MDKRIVAVVVIALIVVALLANPRVVVDRMTTCSQRVPRTLYTPEPLHAAPSLPIRSPEPEATFPSRDMPTPDPAREANATNRRPTRNEDYAGEEFDFALPFKDERVAPPLPQYIDGAPIAPGAPPIDTLFVLSDSGFDWERDYVGRDTLPHATNGGRLIVQKVRTGTLDDAPPPSKLTRAAISGPDAPSLRRRTQLANTAMPTIMALVWTEARDDCSVIARKLEWFRPAVLLMLSDEEEHYARCQGVIETFSFKSQHDGKPPLRVVFRQYSELVTGFDVPHGVQTMPLGYMKDIRVPPALQRDVLRRASKRRLVWSFVGSAKGRRKEMLDALKGRGELAPYLANLGQDIKEHSAQAMTRAYADSIFVPAPRGWRVLDCFRDYEATRMGAIPVVADGRFDEIERTFGHYFREPSGSLPPWVFAESWAEACDKMAALLKNMSALEEMQDANLRWWDRVNYNLRRGIYEALRDNDALALPLAP